MLHFHFCPTAQCKKNHSNQNPHLISLCRSNGFALLHQRGLSRLSVDSLALHVGFLSQTQKPAINLALFPIPDRARPCSVSVSVSVSSFSGTARRTGFDVDETSLDGHADIEGMDASAAHVANLLSSEPSDGTYRTY